MAKAKKEKGAKPGRRERDPSGPTKATTFRISPAGISGILKLSDRLDLRSQAGAIEMATSQLLSMIERLDARPPLTPEQLEWTSVAIQAAGLVPRALGAKANFVILLTAAVTAAEPALVPNECSAKQFNELVETVKQLDAADALWAIGKAIGG